MLGFAIIVAGFGGYDFKYSKVNSASASGKNSIEQLNTIQPFVIVGEGIDNIIHIEPIPGGKLLAQTPLSYRLVDPQTGKMERLPEGFPEGEITQWEEDYAVVRTFANQAKPVTYLYTIWPTMVKCVTSKQNICFTDRLGAYAVVVSEGNIDKLTTLRCYDSTGEIVWDKSIEIKRSFGDFGFLRVFDGKLALGISSEFKLMIFDLANGETLVEGNPYFIYFDAYNRLNYAKPQKGGSFYVYENSLVKPRTERPSHDDPKFSPTKDGFETAWKKDNEIKYSYCVGDDGHALYSCSVDTKNLPGMGWIMDVQNGVILVSWNNSFTYFLEAQTGKILDKVDTDETWQLWSFKLDDTICLVANGMFYRFDTVAKKMIGRFSLPMLARAYGQDTFGYASTDKAGRRGFEVFDIRNPQRKAFVSVPFYNASSSEKGIITWGYRVKKGEILGHLHKYDGGMEPLAYADTTIDIYWMGEYKGEIYGLFGYWWWSDLRETLVAVVKLENGKWVRKIKVANQIYAPFTYMINDGRILTVEHGTINIVKLDEMKEYVYSMPSEMNNQYRYNQLNKLLPDCVIILILTNKDYNKPLYKCIILDLKTGKTTILDKFIGYCNEYVLGSNEDKYYKYEKGTLQEIGKVKFPSDSSFDFSDSGYKLTYDDSYYPNYSSRRDLDVKVWEQSSGWTQSLPVVIYQYTSMPPELYPSNGYSTTYAKPNPSWLPKMKRCASYKVEIKKAGNGEIECKFEPQGADLFGRAWLAVYDQTNDIAVLGKPRELAAKAGQKTTLSFPSISNDYNYPFVLIVESNGFMDVQKTYDNEEAKSALPLFAGMQAGPSGNNVVNAFFWEAPEGDEP